MSNEFSQFQKTISRFPQVVLNSEYKIYEQNAYLDIWLFAYSPISTLR